jgi:AraC-like DNA-binding protein
MPAITHKNLHNILYSCDETRERGHEQFVEDHAMIYVLSGEIRFFTNEGEKLFAAGKMGLIRRNQLAKSIKGPAKDGTPFTAISVLLPTDLLRQFAEKQGIEIKGKYNGSAMLLLKPDAFIKTYFDSLLPYVQTPAALTEGLAEIKTFEAIALLLHHDPAFNIFLFDFQEPHKIDLVAFMNRNFMYNVNMSRFAQLTGRSLATFKRDFQKQFATSPEKWLLQKRLEHAHYLLTKKKQKPSDVYLDVGFENLSHFSTSFKQLYGYNPSAVS